MAGERDRKPAPVWTCGDPIESFALTNPGEYAVLTMHPISVETKNGSGIVAFAPNVKIAHEIRDLLEARGYDPFRCPGLDSPDGSHAFEDSAVDGDGAVTRECVWCGAEREGE